MELNADFSKRAAAHAARMEWTPSPIAGVERRMLDRVGGEVARATTIVRYAPASRFSPHTHGGGEEFLVLDGVFQDEHGDFPAGCYIRNPPTSRHTPGSELGCTLFVKLWQFDPDDRTHVRIDTRKMVFVATPGRPGAEIMPLFRDDREDVRLERWAPGAEITLGDLNGIEVIVLDGGFSSRRGGFRAAVLASASARGDNHRQGGAERRQGVGEVGAPRPCADHPARGRVTRHVSSDHGLGTCRKHLSSLLPNGLPGENAQTSIFATGGEHASPGMTRGGERASLAAGIGAKAPACPTTARGRSAPR